MRLSLTFLLLLTLASCRLSGGGGGGTGGEPRAVDLSLTAFLTSFESVSAGLTVVFTQGTEAGEVKDFEHALLCDPEGSVSLSERVSDNETDGTFEVEMDLDECEGVNGEGRVLGSFFRSPEGLEFEWEHQGLVQNGSCDVDLSALSVTSDARQTPALSLVSGDLTAECTGERSASVVCAWDQNLILNEEALRADCSCTGPGC